MLEDKMCGDCASKHLCSGYGRLTVAADEIMKQTRILAETSLLDLEVTVRCASYRSPTVLTLPELRTMSMVFTPRGERSETVDKA